MTSPRGDLRLMPSLVLVFLLSSCGTPVQMPADKQEYVGAWTSASMCLTISEHATVSYERVGKKGKTVIRAPIKAFEGDDIVVGFLFIKNTFDVEEPPYHDGGTWRMRVDGVELVRTDSSSGCKPVERVGLQHVVVACLRTVLAGL